MNKIQDEYTDRDDLSYMQKFRLRNPDKIKSNNKQSYSYKLKWNKNNPDKVYKHAKTAQQNQRLKKYGITQQEYDTMLSNQNHLCAICYWPKPNERDWHIDHNHTTGKVRAILCQHCNNMLGHGREDKQILLNAIEYLNKYE